MRTFKHVFYTWILSHILHSILFCLADYLQSGSFDIGIAAAALLLGPVFSIPALLVSWYLLRLITAVTASVTIRIGLWFLCTLIALAFNLFFIYFLGYDLFTKFIEALQFITPAIIACWIAILLRQQQFQYLFTSKTYDNESYLV